MAKMIGGIDSISYHRNGTNGPSFHCVRFGAKGYPKLIALVGHDQLDVCVVDIFTDDKFNGQAFNRELRAAIEEWEENRRMEQIQAMNSRGKGE